MQSSQEQVEPFIELIECFSSAWRSSPPDELAVEIQYLTDRRTLEPHETVCVR